MTELEARDLFGPCQDEEKVTPEMRNMAQDAKERMRQALERKKEGVEHPSHYIAGKIECIDAIASALVGQKGIEAFCTGNAIKYLWRWKLKGGVTDLEKAKWYIDRVIDCHKEDGEQA